MPSTSIFSWPEVMFSSGESVGIKTTFLIKLAWEYGLHAIPYTNHVGIYRNNKRVRGARPRWIYLDQVLTERLEGMSEEEIETWMAKLALGSMFDEN